MNTRAQTTNGGIRNFLADEELERNRIVCEGSDAQHVKYPDAVTDIPIGITVDGCDAAEDAVAVALFGRGESKVVKLNGTCSKGDYLTAEDPATAAIGQARSVPATAGAFYVIGQAAEAGIDEQEIAVDDRAPFLAGAQDGNGQLGVPAFAVDPATPVPTQMIVNSADNAFKIYIDGAWRTVAVLSIMLVMMISVLSFGADKTPLVLGDATTGEIAAAVLADNVKVPGTLEVTGTSTFTGAVTLSGGMANGGAVTTIDINGGTIDGAVIGGASAAAITGTTVTGTTITDGTVSMTAGAVTGALNISAATVTYRSIVAADLAAAVQDQVACITVVGADLAAAGTGTITIQAKDAAGNDLAARCLVRTWIGTANDFGPDALTDYSVSTGTSKEEVTANAEYLVVTDATGLAVMAVDNGGAGTVYAWAELGGRIVASGAVELTAP